jgi:putative spermidine/putrescine transport system permease protein
MTADRVVDALARGTFRALQVLALIFCLAPPILLIGLSFFRDVFLSFPPKDATLSLYSELFRSETWREAIIYSFKLGIPTAILTMLIVTPAALALERADMRGRSAIQFMALLPLLLPATGYAVALYVIYLRLDWVGRYMPLMFAEAIISAPVAFLVIRASLQRMPRNLDFVAMSLGASRPRALWDVSVALLRPAILVGALFTMMHVFDDATYVTFLGGPDTVTVSKAIFDSLEYTLDPVVGALSASFMIFTTLLVLCISLLQGGFGRQR